MTAFAIFSEDTQPIEWSETETLRSEFGPKAATLATLPRNWTPPFALVSSKIFSQDDYDGSTLECLGKESIEKIHRLAKYTGALYVRSSVIGETIWDRGSYSSFIVDANSNSFNEALYEAATKVLASAPGKQVGMVLQSYVHPRAQGEFGNLLRVSKTRDHWELSSEGADTTSRVRLNTQRDTAANPKASLDIKARVPRERLFGSIAAWLNNYLLRGHLRRVNCEWIADHHRVYLVQIDEEDEDFLGINPLQIRVAPVHQPLGAKGTFLAHAAGEALHAWDKLSVLNELWEPSASHKPTLFFTPLKDLPSNIEEVELKKLAQDFRDLIGPDNIVVRTSVRTGAEKLMNLPRTEGLSPEDAAKWCLTQRDECAIKFNSVDNLAFVAHRFMAARSSAWVRAEPGNPLVEIHSLWGLPDALQYCPYDIWEVHLPTEVATEYPDYKSHMLVAREDGGWEYVRIKNEFGRSLSISRREAMDLASRTASISERIGQACHVMWFVGCEDKDGTHFNIPWYWTAAHETEKNIDRSNYHIFKISNEEDIEKFRNRQGSNVKHALELKPMVQDLMRDMKFISAVGETAKKFGVPVILAGSTLAHAYFELRRRGCTVVTLGEKEHSRIRRNTSFGKIVRDKIPDRIAKRKEISITKKVPEGIKKNFLVSKLLEEALEVRNAETPEEKKMELADVYEVLRAIANEEGISLSDIVLAADEKRGKAGGFDEGLILLQTGISGRNRDTIHESDRQLNQLLARRLSGSAFELPFTFFGFMEFDQPRTLFFDDLAIRIQITLKSDRIEMRASREPEQLELFLDSTSDHYSEMEGKGGENQRDLD